jgi:hypothetical protein
MSNELAIALIIIGMIAGTVLLWQTLRFIVRHGAIFVGPFVLYRDRWPRAFRIYLLVGWIGLALCAVGSVILSIAILAGFYA